MEVVFEICCGLDVHAKSVMACLNRRGRKEIRTFGTMTRQLLELRDWLVGGGCTDVAMEATGVYWKPVFNILEGAVDVTLVNARHVKAVKGRKTDVRDCEWLADLLRHGLLKASFIPPKEIRDLRELTRYRAGLVSELTALSNRIQKEAESGNIKLGQVASRAMGVSGREMLTQLSEGVTDVEVLSDLARGRLREKKEALREALEGRLTETQRWLLAELLRRFDEAEAALERVEERIDQEIQRAKEQPVKDAILLLDGIPGIGEATAEAIISEIGVDMTRFPTAGHLASWAGMCPGNDESAGKRRNTRTNPANRYLKGTMVEAAWAASHTKDTFLSALYRRLVRRMGKKKALVAVAHRMLVVVYHVLARRLPYKEIQVMPVRPDSERQQRRLIKKLETLGLKVTVQRAA
jgi:transposase